jgi:hypothetical protein
MSPVELSPTFLASDTTSRFSLLLSDLLFLVLCLLIILTRQVFVGGQDTPVDGTSASTPTFAAQVSMLNSLRLAKNLPTMGWINPFIYQNQAAFKGIIMPPFEFPSVTFPILYVFRYH